MASAAWLVDMGYVVKAAQGLFKLDYVAAANLLAGRFGSVGTFLFNGFDPHYGIPPGLHAFYEAMAGRGMTICLHPMSGAAGSGDHRQRRVDVDLAAHIVWQASQPDVHHIILTSGDQDFVPALRIARARYGKRFVLFTYRRDVHAELRDLAAEWLLFEEYEAEIARS